ncbi:MAG: transposase, partial [Gemmatimonadetes bacterium]|nr:transposase [Gemmatimonadota bacterium]
AVEAHLHRLFTDGPEGAAPRDGEVAVIETPAESAPVGRDIRPADAVSSAALAAANEAQFDWLDAHGRPPRETTTPGDCWAADYRVSTTDADATVLNLKNGGPRLGYHAHYLVDGGKARLIVNVLVTPAEVKENEPFLDLFRQARFRWRLRPRQVTGDSKYGTTEIVAALERQGIHAYMPLPAPNPRQGLYPKEAFTYDAARDAYICPQGAALARHHVTYTEQVVHYRAPAATCNACPCKDRCTTGDQGRTVRRQFDEDCLDRVRAYRGTAPYEKALRKRGVWVEPLFAEAKDWHGLRRFRLRGLEKVNREALLVAAGQNLKRLVSRQGWGRRPWPGGATGLRLVPVVAGAAI